MRRMLLAMFRRSQIAAVFLVSLQVFAQTDRSRPVAELDLKLLGVKVPESGAVSATALELLFLSDNHLVLLEESGRLRNARLTLYEIGSGRLRPMKTIDPGEAVLPITPDGLQAEKVLNWIDPEHFAYWTYKGKAIRWLCDTDLDCKQDGQGPQPEAVPPARICNPTDFLGFIDTQRAVCLAVPEGAKWSAEVLDITGRPLYEVEQGLLPWDARMVNSGQGERFGLEWKSNALLQLLNPLACFDDCPPAGRERFVVFNSSDGRVLQSFEWDPRPYNLYVLPGLSPSGKTAAFVRKDRLEIYSLDGVR
ncbi:MAG TPA: hypothetical protein VMT38_04595 [Terracidiphilus sp.]|nr:hypothetical protein [Terracidiphilus sp.]